MTHIMTGEMGHIGPGNDLVPVRCQAITSTNADVLPMLIFCRLIFLKKESVRPLKHILSHFQGSFWVWTQSMRDSATM